MKKRASTVSPGLAGQYLAKFSGGRGSLQMPPGGWLRAGREARGISQQLLAAKLGIKRQAWAQLEASEAREAISLYSLRRAADALGYDLTYGIVPRETSSRDSAVDPAIVRSADGDDPPGGWVSPAIAALAAEVILESPAWPEAELPVELR